VQSIANSSSDSADKADAGDKLSAGKIASDDHDISNRRGVLVKLIRISALERPTSQLCRYACVYFLPCLII